MKTLYFECNMGAAGDMLMAALLELHSNPIDFLNRLNSIGIPNTNISAEPSVKCGIKGTHINVAIKHLHHHSDYHTLGHLIEHLNISETVKNNALAVYKSIAEAESQVHGVPVNQIHFHELGEMDAVADIVGFCMLIEELSPELILASPVNVGSGQIKCAHGILPVPAPATTLILQNIPIYSDDTNGELCTPTGAALLKYFAKEFRKMPVMKVTGLGYGMGKKDFEKANCLRAYIGDTDNTNEEVIELVCNLDDITPEALAFAQQLLLDKGALDVYITPIIMKKGRAGFSFTCMCKLSDRDKMLQLIFKHTTTLGVREYSSNRHILQREQTEFGSVRIKTSQGFGVRKSKLEYEDVAALAKKHDHSIAEAEAHIKYEKLKNYLQELGNVAIAFSGGVDSTFLLKTAHDVLGDRVIAVSARSCSFPKRELDEAAAFCKKEGIAHIIFDSEELEIEGFSKNPANRCYLCKRELFTKILNIAKEHKILHIAEGSNKDDEGDYRPGLTAVVELGIKSPLRYAELNKREIRHLSKEMNLPTWNKQSFACLSSRFPYGEEINPERLGKIDKAEQFLLDSGFHQVRVRYHGNLARIETDEEGFALMSSPEKREKIYTTLKELGFTYIALDLLGYRTGSMNDTLTN
ncbi:MAG: nickel pincer cofactor biosynthesis protein LarC [Fibromonadaceae bacterium]|jgi:uncharacterized protein (TIGR00299 family) protein/uncharacterized protein (TIGR00268 family)|nr:nickel pincer cofactor biosynthesis protein LarC [Fibromonadaceae bacterium]